MPDSPKKRVRAVRPLDLLALLLSVALLLWLLFPLSHGRIRKQARRAIAKNDIHSIVEAVKQYHEEYGNYPPGSGERLGPQAIINLLPALRGEDLATNPKRIVFLEVKEARLSDSFFNKKLGNGFDPATGAFLDPWGHPYRVIYGPDTTGHIASPYPDEAPIMAGVIAWSLGEDGIQSTARSQSGKDSDDIASWP